MGIKIQQRSDRVRTDHRGITFVELIIAIAISTIIMGAATLFLGTAHKNYNHATAQIDLQSESQILMEQLSMWVMEGNRVVKEDDANSTRLIVYQIPRKNVDGSVSDATKRVFWMPKSGKKLYMQSFTIAASEEALRGSKADSSGLTPEEKYNNFIEYIHGDKSDTGLSADEAHLIGEYVTSFEPTISSDSGKVTISLKMEYLKQKYEIQNDFKLRNALR